MAQAGRVEAVVPGKQRDAEPRDPFQLAVEIEAAAGRGQVFQERFPETSPRQLAGTRLPGGAEIAETRDQPLDARWSNPLGKMEAEPVLGRGVDAARSFLPRGLNRTSRLPLYGDVVAPSNEFDRADVRRDTGRNDPGKVLPVRDITASFTYREGNDLEPAAVAELYRAAGLRRPVDDLARIGAMLAHANLVISAWDGARLIGVARALSDLSYATYLSDLAVHPTYQGRGVGRELVERVAARGGAGAALLLRASPDAGAYYPRIGFTPLTRGYVRERQF